MSEKQWRVYTNTVRAGDLSRYDVRDRAQLDSRVCRVATMEDAVLIAATPELLAAAIDVLELHEHEQDRPAVRRLRQAIAKATGKEASE